MNALGLTLNLPDEMPSYLAVLGGLLCWKLHELEVQLGRIQPKDVRDVLRHLAQASPILLRRSAALVRPSAAPWLFIYLSKNDSQTCVRCAKVHLRVFSGSDPGEAPVKICCVNPNGCRCVVIPIDGQWRMAQRLPVQLSSQGGFLQLSERDLRALTYPGNGNGEQDELARRLLSAMLDDETNPRAARQAYMQVIAGTPKGSNALLQAAAYIRLADLLERSGDLAEALQVTRSFLRAFTEKDRERVLDKAQHERIMARKTRLLRCLLLPPSASESHS